MHYDNGAHYVRFVVTFMIGITAGCLQYFRIRVMWYGEIIYRREIIL